ncbi:putative glyoxalase/bleomycin resistance protein [Zafaria cholistanensis]|uniref:Putative glyoxalase/bleomycin resistance protein n=1 Tax=Zafaria cholistanensis TaxID=1682741 RepID=A0A5A7NQ78_9MICC|nr:VOC family protein [Zafaria cholistanensis]GER22849.1 putative glyoxalase/bleomycin resistance protein [Zafaria cholistanensis]
MPIRETTAAGEPVWTDIASTDFEKTKAFYAGLFGWTYDEPAPEEYGGYVTARLNGQMVAGLSPHQPEMGVPNVWGLYLKSDGIEATADAVRAAGGQVLVPPMHVDPYGHMAIFSDAGGVAIGAWQPQTHQGFGVDAEHGAPAWFELHTRDFAAAVPFYERAFGWKTSVLGDTDEFRYRTLGEGDAARAGIMDGARYLPAEVPGFWVTYWGANDVDAAVAQAVELGGRVITGAEDTPYGRMATVEDPTGAALKLIGVGG